MRQRLPWLFNVGSRSATITLARSVVMAAESLGAPRELLMAALGMCWDDLGRFDVRVPSANTAALWNAIERWSNDPLIALKIARVIAASSSAALFQYTMRAAPSVEVAWARLTPMLGLFFGEGFESVTRSVDSTWELGYHLPTIGEGPIPRSEEAIVVGFVEQYRAVAPGFTPIALCFQHAANAPVADWRRELDAPVEFGATFYGVRISERVYRSLIPGHDPSLASLIEALAAPFVVAPVIAPTPVEPTERAIRSILERGESVTVDSIAKTLHVSRRTLQRKLAAEKTSVREELERVRKQAALVLLKNPAMTIAEVATRLGFAEPSQFTRAVRRWTGRTPSKWRQRPTTLPPDAHDP